MKSVMSHNFSQVPAVEIPRSVFDRTHGHKTTLDAGYLIPVYVDEALPGDTFTMNHTFFGRLATPAVPIMDNLKMDVHYFAVPMRLVWDKWQRFCGEQEDPDQDNSGLLIPQMVSGSGFNVGGLSDYFGLPTGVADLSVSALYHRAYALIWNEWYRDQNLQDRTTFNKGDSDEVESDYPVKRRNKRHDYFTSCLPWPQKGDAVPFPIGGTAPVYGDGKALGIRYKNDGGTFDSAGLIWCGTQANTLGLSNEMYGHNVGDSVTYPNTQSVDYATGVVTSGESGLRADLSQATAATINDIREAFQLQRMLERDARGGSRYVELIKSHFGVTCPDFRLQRPEFLGGSTLNINVHPVMQTSQTTEDSPQGNLAAFGTLADSGNGFTKSFTEHTIIMGIASVRADLTYQRGIPRGFSRMTRYDFYWPSLAHLGEQEVLNKEIYADGTAADEEVFGYQERYAEYRYFPSKITNKFRSTDAQSLDVWHLSQDFGNTRPALNNTFMIESPPLDRVLAVADEPEILLDCLFQLRCVRPMPVYSVPGLVDHF